ncbi:hypothetical protein HN011_009601 [Eciton burchellii]|nr:hypothetical protein HN011_009601 [Eciton burchellii]
MSQFKMVLKIAEEKKQKKFISTLRSAACGRLIEFPRKSLDSRATPPEVGGRMPFRENRSIRWRIQFRANGALCPGVSRSILDTSDHRITVRRAVETAN